MIKRHFTLESKTKAWRRDPRTGATAPANWSDAAIEIAATKYFRDGETSVAELFARVVDAIAEAGRARGDFDHAEVDVFREELTEILLTQRASFNSPVYFNVGRRERPQASACFIQSLGGGRDQIFDLLKTEARLFAYGSGTGTNFSNVRENLIPYLEVFDKAARVVRSGGVDRRAAKMVVLDADHPDALAFVRWKTREEAKARALIEAGFSGGMDGEALATVSGQNSNNSLRVSDEFMRAAEAGEAKSAELLRECARAAWACADPGLQFDDAIQRWHAVPLAGPIRASNPCAEFMFLDDTACNLASLNLARVASDDLADLRHVARVMLIAQDILVDLAGYPTEAITTNSRAFRPLGLGYANLGGWLMRLGIPYDSAEAAERTRFVTAALHAVALETSAELAGRHGPFADWARHRDHALAVLKKHQAAWTGGGAIAASFATAIANARATGLRNAQVTLLAPTGTIGLLMDCDTLGIEPEFSLNKIKSLTGGGELRLKNSAVAVGLAKLGYAPVRVDEIARFARERGHVVGAPGLDPGHAAVFDCALPPAGHPERRISVEGHLRIMAAAQPFLSGAISKTVNLPAEATVVDVERCFRRAWAVGLKSVSIYRDGAKSVQPLCVDC